ncbi:hypothetical protein Bequi_01845 [Brachybacterium sp. JHP9]|uniref:Alpha/beta hydrolase n=1 Tax=Brachybacterium equifaecis TaxID=2910770 RepID=A0ABT0QWW1_9MICO|nr:hypothetical protein [Brachybacterium equifaecis]MCL6422144.1 hypothetical protein [Brachybacterium equifaecis]
MSGFLGMDVEAARARAAQWEQHSAELLGSATALGGAVRAAVWEGPDAEAFREDWTARADAPWREAAEALARCARDLERHAAQQEAASATDSAAPTAPSGPAGPAPAYAGIGTPMYGLAGGYQGIGTPMYGRAGGPPAALSSAWGGTAAGRAPGPSLVADRTEVELITPLDWMMARFPGGAANPRVQTLDAHVDNLARIALESSPLGRPASASELIAGGILVAGSAAALSPPGLARLPDGFLDPRTEVRVRSVQKIESSAAPRSLADLILATDEARRTLPGTDHPFDSSATGQIRIQAVRPADGGEIVYVVHLPPTEGEDISSPFAWGPQGNPSDWGADVQLVAGERTASMAQVEAAMATPGADGEPLVPAGARVLLVSHSQGGIVAAALAADPLVNSTSGAEGTYRITHSLSVGSPVESLSAARNGTQVVNVAHGPMVPAVPPDGDALLLGSYGTIAGDTMTAPVLVGDPRDMLGHLLNIPDLVPTADVGGLRLGIPLAGGPGATDIVLPTPRGEHGGEGLMQDRHNSVQRGSGEVDGLAGYYGTLREHQDTDPQLSALQRDLEGTYIGPGVQLVGDVVVETSREDLRPGS